MSGSTSYQNKAKSDVNFESNLARIDVKATANDWIETSVSSPVSTEDSGNTRDYVINTIEVSILRKCVVCFCSVYMIDSICICCERISL